MSQLVANCPRCGTSRITFDLKAVSAIEGAANAYEAFCICRHCGQATIFLLSANEIQGQIIAHAGGLELFDGTVNHVVRIVDYVSLKDKAATPPPEHLPKEIKAVFSEGATCLAVGCLNAAGTMFRLCVDLATKSLLPATDGDGLNPRVRHSLGLTLVVHDI